MASSHRKPLVNTDKIVTTARTIPKKEADLSKDSSFLSYQTSSETQDTETIDDEGADLVEIRKRYCETDKVEIKFDIFDFDPRFLDYIGRLRRHLYALYESTTISLNDAEFMKLTVEKLRAVDSENEKQEEFRRMYRGLKSLEKHYLLTLKPVKRATDVIYTHDPTASSGSEKSDKKRKLTKIECSVATWDEDVISDQWYSFDMMQLHRDASQDVINGCYERYDFKLHVLSNKVPKSKKQKLAYIKLPDVTKPSPKYAASPMPTTQRKLEQSHDTESKASLGKSSTISTSVGKNPNKTEPPEAKVQSEQLSVDATTPVDIPKPAKESNHNTGGKPKEEQPSEEPDQHLFDMKARGQRSSSMISAGHIYEIALEPYPADIDSKSRSSVTRGHPANVMNELSSDWKSQINLSTIEENSASADATSR